MYVKSVNAKVREHPAKWLQCEVRKSVITQEVGRLVTNTTLIKESEAKISSAKEDIVVIDIPIKK